jgi:ABC-type transport system substrate-binding protein
MIRILFLLFGLNLLLACGSERERAQGDFTVTVRLSGDPEGLHPMLSRSATATQIESHIFLPLQQYDPIDLQLLPVLIKQKPLIESRGDTLVYAMEIRAEAEWMDGKAVTGYDYLFTLKAALLGPVGSAWRGVLLNVFDVWVDPMDPKKFTVKTGMDYVLSEQLISTFMIYPEHLFDSLHVLRSLSMAQLRENKEDMGTLVDAFVDQFKSWKNFEGVVYGSGPYFMSSYIPERQMVLEKVNGWWGDQFAQSSVLFRAFPAQIYYSVIPDEFTALNALQQGAVEVMSEVPPKDFMEMSQKEELRKRLRFFTPPLLQQYIMAFNLRNDILVEEAVREAIDIAIDKQQLIDELFYGYAMPSDGPIHPLKPFYQSNAEVGERDLNKAKLLLENAGWELNSRGIRIKAQEGKSKELRLEISTSNKQLGNDFARVIAAQLEEIGIAIDIRTLDTKDLIKAARTKEYQMALLALRQNPGLEDPYTYWHSDMDQPGGNNFFAYRSEAVDSLIGKIRVGREDSYLYTYYAEFQEAVRKDKPAVFLVIPQERLIISQKFDALTSGLRPGYFEGNFQLR